MKRIIIAVALLATSLTITAQDKGDVMLNPKAGLAIPGADLPDQDLKTGLDISVGGYIYLAPKLPLYTELSFFYLDPDIDALQDNAAQVGQVIAKSNVTGHLGLSLGAGLGYDFTLTDRFSIIPNVMVSLVGISPLQIDSVTGYDADPERLNYSYAYNSNGAAAIALKPGLDFRYMISQKVGLNLQLQYNTYNYTDKKEVTYRDASTSYKQTESKKVTAAQTNLLLGVVIKL